MGAFFVLPVLLLVIRWKQLPITKKDEETYSREFWLFIGALVLSVSCVQVIATTSIPVFNALFGTKVAPPADVIQHYNKWQVPFAIVVALISAFSQFLKYKRTDLRKFWVSIISSGLVALLITAVFVYITKIYTNPVFIILTFAGVFSILANGRILGEAFKGKWKLAGSAIAHIGFGLLLVGALIAAATNKVISVNQQGFIPVKDFEKADKPGDNLMLYLNEPVKMDKFTVTYVGDTTEGPNTYYQVNYKVIDEKTGKISEEFTLHPNAQQNSKMGLVASPDTRHYLTYDVYTHATAAPNKQAQEDHEPHEGHENEKYGEPTTAQVKIGDTVKINNGFIVVKSVNRNAQIQNIPVAKGDLAVAMNLEVHLDKQVFKADPIFLLKNGQKFDFSKTMEKQGLKLRFSNIMPEQDKLELMVYQTPESEKKWIVMKAIVFPYINLFWGGTIIMVVGFLMSIFRRNKELKTA